MAEKSFFGELIRQKIEEILFAEKSMT